MSRFVRIPGTLFVVDTTTGEGAYAPHPRATPQCVLKVSGGTGEPELLPWPTRADLAAERRGNSVDARWARRRDRRIRLANASIRRRAARLGGAGIGTITLYAGKVGDTREPVKMVAVFWDNPIAPDETTVPWSKFEVVP